nr:uncharacterized protein LOC121119683 isoform X2 [Lepeophtheirus salmonis]
MSVQNRKKKPYSYCSVVGCDSAYGKGLENVKMFCFPLRNMEQRELWIKAIKRVNEDGTMWKPRYWSRICSKHFITGKYNPTRGHPDYFPTLFPTSHVHPRTFSDIERHGRFFKRREIKKRLEVPTSKVDSSRSSRTTQTDGEFQSLSHLPIFFSHFDGKDLSCQFNAPPSTSEMGTAMPKVHYKNKGTSVDIKTDEEFKNRFSIKNVVTNEDFKACCGVEKWFFDFLLLQFESKFKKVQGTMFNIHRITVSIIFSTMLQEVSKDTNTSKKMVHLLKKHNDNQNHQQSMNT